MAYFDKNAFIHFWSNLKTYVAEQIEAIPTVSTTVRGLMSNTDKTKLDGIATGANKTTVDTVLSTTSTNPVQNKVINTALGNKVDKVDGKGLSTNDYTTTEKTKLAGIAEGANKTTVDASLSASSTNPVQNKAVNTALGNKVDKVSGKGLSTNDFTNDLKTKLDGVESGAQKNTPSFNTVYVYDGISVTETMTAGFLEPADALMFVSGDNVVFETTTEAYPNRIKIHSIDTKYSKVTASADGLMSKEDKSKLDAFSPASDYAKKSDITSMMEWKGSVATYDKLPTNAEKGDTYNVESDGMNYTWTGTEWDANGSTFTITAITNAEIDEIMAN